jgi:hypothetical protein
MSRQFASGDEVTWSIGSVAGTGAWTFAFIAKISSGTSVWGSLLNLKSGATTRLGTTRRGTADTFTVSLNDESSFADYLTDTWVSGDGWSVLVASRPAGAAQTVACTICNVGGSPSSGNMTGTLGNATAPTSLQFGNINGVDDFIGFVAAIAFWDTNLNQTERESLASTMTRANWASLEPVFLVDELDVFQTDWNGSSTRTGLTGTTDSADDPTGWESWAGGGGGGGGTSTFVMPHRVL